VAAAGWALSSLTDPGVVLHFASVYVQGQSQSVWEQKSKEPEYVHVERAGGEGGVYGEDLFLGEKRAHNHGYVLVHMWICSRKERPACSLEVTEKFCDFDFNSSSEDSSLLLEQFTE